MLESLIAAWKLPELRKRILFVFAAFGVYACGLHIPLPNIDHAKMEALFSGGGMFGLVDVFSGGAMRKFTILAMGIIPYINASIIFQLLTAAVPQLKELQKEGESGRKQINKYVRYFTILLAFMQSFGISLTLQKSGILDASLIQVLATCIILTAGTMFLMWLGEQITENGIGNGISMIIFCSICAGLPWQLGKTWDLVKANQQWFGLIMLLILFLASVVAIVFVTQANRRIPVQHARRVVGMRQVGGHTSYMPFKIAMAGVIPIIFAISLQMLPATLATALPRDLQGNQSGFVAGFIKVANWLVPSVENWWALIIFGMLIMGFTYFYTAVQFDVNDIADNLKKSGAYIPGIRPGKPTADYLDRVITRITTAGAVFLTLVAVVQYIAPAITGVAGRSFSLVGGTSLLIIVGVALETMQAIEAQLMMRNYQGFLKE